MLLQLQFIKLVETVGPPDGEDWIRRALETQEYKPDKDCIALYKAVHYGICTKMQGSAKATCEFIAISSAIGCLLSKVF